MSVYIIQADLTKPRYTHPFKFMYACILTLAMFQLQ